MNTSEFISKGFGARHAGKYSLMNTSDTEDDVSDILKRRERHCAFSQPKSRQYISLCIRDLSAHSVLQNITRTFLP